MLTTRQSPHFHRHRSLIFRPCATTWSSPQREVDTNAIRRTELIRSLCHPCAGRHARGAIATSLVVPSRRQPAHRAPAHRLRSKQMARTMRQPASPASRSHVCSTPPSSWSISIRGQRTVRAIPTPDRSRVSDANGCCSRTPWPTTLQPAQASLFNLINRSTSSMNSLVERPDQIAVCNLQ